MLLYSRSWHKKWILSIQLWLSRKNLFAINFVGISTPPSIRMHRNTLTLLCFARIGLLPFKRTSITHGASLVARICPVKPTLIIILTQSVRCDAYLKLEVDSFGCFTYLAMLCDAMPGEVCLLLSFYLIVWTRTSIIRVTHHAHYWWGYMTSCSPQ